MRSANCGSASKESWLQHARRALSRALKQTGAFIPLRVENLPFLALATLIFVRLSDGNVARNIENPETVRCRTREASV